MSHLQFFMWDTVLFYVKYSKYIVSLIHTKDLYTILSRTPAKAECNSSNLSGVFLCVEIANPLPPEMAYLLGIP